MNDIKKIQQQYDSLMLKEKLTKKDICDLLVPFRDKYGLTDLQALKIARKQLKMTQIKELIYINTLKNVSKTPAYYMTCRDLAISIRWYKDIDEKIMIMLMIHQYRNGVTITKTEHFSLAQLNRGYSALKWLNEFSNFGREELKFIKDTIIKDVITNNEYYIKIGE